MSLKNDFYSQCFKISDAYRLSSLLLSALFNLMPISITSTERVGVGVGDGIGIGTSVGVRVAIGITFKCRSHQEPINKS